MSKALSVDLRERVVDAVEGGASRRQAAERFGVSASGCMRESNRMVRFMPKIYSIKHAKGTRGDAHKLRFEWGRLQQVSMFDLDIHRYFVQSMSLACLLAFFRLAPSVL